MNAYLVREDGEVKIWIATTMASALELAWDRYVEEQLDPDDHGSVVDEREQYEQEILQSCELIGEVGNP